MAASSVIDDQSAVMGGSLFDLKIDLTPGGPDL